ncbi:MAG: HlyD family efflux transporter periplasmic adaptor subunit [Verrucomicrobiota bacterium]
MSVDHRVSEISTSRPRLRRDVRTHYQEYRGRPSYIIEDASKGKFFHVGFPEHQFIQSFDGHTTISEAVARNAATQGEDALTEQQGDQLMRWLIDNDLLEDDTSGQGERRRDQWVKNREKQKKNPIQKLMFFRIPLGCPNRLVGWLNRGLGWIFSLHGVLLWLALIVYTALQLAPRWNEFIAASASVVVPENWIKVVLIYAVLKILHELGHGVATRKYDGEVPEWGIQLLVFITPMAYVDASASWKFPSKWKRIIVSAAGMYVEIALACLCIIGWLRTDPGVMNTMLHNAVIAATFVTVVFNANPLMRFDGYYILIDLIGIPNLGTKGQQFMKWFGKRFLLGMKDLEMPPAVRQHPVAVPLYGVLAAIWKLIIWIGIMVLLSLLFKGAGLVLAVASITLMLVGATYKFLKFLFAGASGPKLSRALPRLGILLVAVALILFLVRINPTGKAVAVVENADSETVRTAVRGLVESVEVRDGDQVSEGDLLISLSNPDEESEFAKLELELQEARIRARRFYDAENLPAYQAELETVASLESKYAESLAYIEALELRAPVEGEVLARGLQSLPGSWLEIGSEVLKIVSSDQKELLISFRTEDIDSLGALNNGAIEVRLRGRGQDLSGEIERIESRATRALPHEVMSSSNGGPLALRTAADPIAEREREIAQGGGDYDSDLDYFSGISDGAPPQELAKPRFVGRAKITGDPDFEIYEGEWGYVRLDGAEKERLGKWLYEEISGYIRKKIEQAKAASQA